MAVVGLSRTSAQAVSTGKRIMHGRTAYNTHASGVMFESLSSSVLQSAYQRRHACAGWLLTGLHRDRHMLRQQTGRVQEVGAVRLLVNCSRPLAMPVGR